MSEITTKQFKRYPQINKTYRHYKGGTYVVIMMATHTESKEELVIYKNLEHGTHHARPMAQWFEAVKGEGAQMVIRFTEI